MKLFIYSSGQDRAVTAQAKVERVEAGPPEVIWSMHSAALGISRSEFDAYFAGAEVAYALHLNEVVQNRRPIPLQELRKSFGLEPPQSWRYLTEDLSFRLESISR
ncbi:hypothetical protein [Paenarthrobacter ureafaciens]|uniref:hypothetical protein n=1 Tax=Paenarthrobacter ureafaciens TaxID=37931 RepID=UPI002DBE8B1C|nr:hypothetical protein [Paenarthrobacter ureafaciens]MEC3851961.1 hypothetical protein [Paenarthrobacter ureafaciens]